MSEFVGKINGGCVETVIKIGGSLMNFSSLKNLCKISLRNADINYKDFWRKWLNRKKLHRQISRADVRFAAIKNNIKGNNVLDFGYGSGYFIEKLSIKGFNVTGIDFFRSRKIQKRKNITLITLNNVEDLKSLSFERKFDTIIASEILEHLNKNEINKAMKFFYDWLKEEGKLIITVPYREKIEKTILCPYCLKWFHPSLHKQSFDEKNIVGLLRKYDFSVEKIKYITFFEFIGLPLLFKNFLSLALSYFSKRSRILMVIVSKKK
jgi:2-polyprenyl-3-methyl-5-hydroxy-6-metoxy-1,4-benzoquinol methylase